MDHMPYPEPVTVRERIRRHLATATGPLTTRRLAELADTKPEQAARALRRLEDDGTAARQLANGGCYAWTATRPSARVSPPSADAPANASRPAPQ